jgi:outer membrane protein W
MIDRHLQNDALPAFGVEARARSALARKMLERRTREARQRSKEFIMKTAKQILAGTVLAMAIGAPAHAEELGAITSREGPPASTGLEIAVGAGYSQAFGNITAGRSISDLATGGGALEVDLGYRLIPNLSLGLYGTGSTYAIPSNATLDNAWSMSAGVQAAWHFRPDGLFDPWFSLGSGWRGMWTVGSGTTQSSRHGWEIARIQAGVDYRINESVAVSPVIGVDLSMFFTEKLAGDDGFHNVSSPETNTFVYAGLLSRFDIQTN